MKSVFPTLVCVAILVGCGEPGPGRLVDGEWRARLDGPGGGRPFGLEVSRDGTRLGFVIINGPERIRVPRVEARDGEKVRRHAERHGVDYPLLIAGRSDKTEAPAAFPLVDRVRAYPTTVVQDDAGAVRAVHSGFSGPATGEDHEELRQRFETLIEELLDTEQAES